MAVSRALIDAIGMRIYFTPRDAVVCTNAGDAPAYPNIKITGPGTVFELENATTEKMILLEGVELGEADYLEIDFKHHTIIKNGEDYAYNALIFASSNWWVLEPGENEIIIAGGAAEIEWQDTYL